MRLSFPAFLKSKMIIGKNIRAFLILHTLKLRFIDSITSQLLPGRERVKEKKRERARERETQNNKKDTKVFFIIKYCVG